MGDLFDGYGSTLAPRKTASGVPAYDEMFGSPAHSGALAESRETVLADCLAVRPTVMSGVPYFFEKVCRYLSEQGRADEPDALRNLLGGRMRVCCAGGAALPDHVFDFFQRQGVPILQGYGLTESSPVITASTFSRCKRGCGSFIPTRFLNSWCWRLPITRTRIWRGFASRWARLQVRLKPDTTFVSASATR